MLYKWRIKISGQKYNAFTKTSKDIHVHVYKFSGK